MSTLSGVIEAIKVREITSGKRPFTSVSYKIGPDWVSFVKNKDNKMELEMLIQGDAVEVEYVQSGNFKNGETIKVVKSAEVPKTVKGSTAAVKVENRDFRITYAGSRNTAIAFAELAMKAGAITLPKKVSDIEAALMEYVDALTIEFANKAWNSSPGVPAELAPVAVANEDDNDNFKE